MSSVRHGEAIVGRGRELAVLRAGLDAARRGAGRLVLCAGEPGIGKTRLAQELAGLALAGGTAVAWGRCLEGEGAPAFWPWRQVLRSLAVDPAAVLAGDGASPEDRFRVFDEITTAVRSGAGPSGLVVVLDDIHWADEASLLALRHLAHHIADARLLVLATFRDVEPVGVLPRTLPDLLRSPGVERVDLRGFGLDEVRAQISGAAGVAPADQARAVLDLTGGNPLFVREVARAMAEGAWRPDRPPSTVLEIVRARLDRVSPACRRLVQAAAVVGRDFALPLVAAVLGAPVTDLLTPVDEAVAHGLVDRVGEAGDHRFVHALAREAVEASLGTAERVALHRAAAEAMEAMFAADLSEHLTAVARHWAELAPYGEAATARRWAIRAADDSVRRLAYEEGVRHYRAALAVDPASLGADERARVLVALGRAAHLSGDLRACAEAAQAAAGAAAAARSPELVAEAALVLEASADPATNALAERLCEQALAGVGEGREALRARLLAQRSHLAFYAGDADRVDTLSAAALGLAQSSGHPGALVAALHARKEAFPGPAGREERTALASEMVALGVRTGDARGVLRGDLWLVEALIEGGEIHRAAEALAALQVSVERVGGPVSAWHLDRVAACVAQAQGRYGEATRIARRGLERMLPVEPGPARGSYFAHLCAIAGHLGVTAEMAPFVERRFEPLPRFVTMARLSRAFLLLRAGLRDEAAASYQQAGPIDGWSPPAFFAVPCHVFAVLAAVDLGRHDDLAVLLDRLEAFRGGHAAGDGVLYLGPVELALGRGAAALGRLDDAVADLGAAAGRADRSGAPGFAAEARFHLAAALVARGGPGDRPRAEEAARDADRLARTLGMAAYVERTGALVAQLGATRPAPLSDREVEVAKLVARGLTNRQIAERLVISERTAQNHVQHILTKLGFSSRSQIAAWSAAGGRWVPE